MQKISNIQAKSNLEESIAYGNHKSAIISKEWMVSSLDKEIMCGWQLPLPTDALHLIPNAMASPMGNAQQTTIDEKGIRVPKNRLTHNQSMVFGSGNSINSRVIEDELSLTQYGFALLRFLHLIVALRLNFPNVCILLSKLDFKPAYRRVHNDPDAIAHGFVTLGDLGRENVSLASLRLTFGGKPCPSIFSDISEATCDLANAISRIFPWNITDDTPSHADILQDPIYLKNDNLLPKQLPCSWTPALINMEEVKCLLMIFLLLS